MTVPVKLARLYDEPFLIEPTQKDSHNGSQHSGIPTLVDMKDSKPIMCRVLNNTNTTVKIPGLTTVCTPHFPRSGNANSGRY